MERVIGKIEKGWCNVMIRKIVKVRSSVKGVGRAPSFVREFCRENAIMDNINDHLCVVLEEILPNIATISTSPRICLEMVKKDQTVEFIISHNSEKYDIADQYGLLWPENAENTRINESSMKIIHTLMDRIECSYEAGVNTTCLVKYLS